MAASAKDIQTAPENAPEIIETGEGPAVEVTGLEPKAIAAAALENQVMVYELTPLTASLEEAYMELTKDDVEYHSLPAAEVSK